jgi:alpha-N-arabinofuranosidase
MLKRFGVLAAFSMAVLLVPALRLTAQTQATVTVDLQEKKSAVSPTLYGLMTEEINYSYDGGLYAELVRNRTFRSDWTGILNWSLVEKGHAHLNVATDEADGPTTALPRSVKLTVTKASPESPAGILNEGYWGMAVRPNAGYTGSFFAKSDQQEPFPVRVALVNDRSGAVIAGATVTVSGTGWKQYAFTLQAGKVLPSSDNHLEVTVDRPMTLWLQLVSLLPPTYHERPNGTRIDIMEKLAAMHPSFLRFPGGNYVEGGRISERFDWKKTIGPLAYRPTHQAPWSYWSSDGMGLLEFLEWCEDLKMEPVLAVFAGYSLNGEVVKPGPALEPYVQDALDEIEYVTGGANTKWGAIRVRDGHPEPFQLRYVEVGNEDFFDKAKTYDGRFAQFYKAIKSRYPKLKVIATEKVEGTVPDVVDDHYYRTALGMFDESRHYDKADRKGTKIFIGEWATREGSPTTNFGAALGDAAFMTGIERNSDLIVMAAYAPLFVNVNPGGMQWWGNLIGYDALNSYGSPSYYAQVMFSSCLGDYTPVSSVTDAGDKFFYSVTASTQAKKVCLKLVNASSAEQAVTVRVKGLGAGESAARVQTLSAKSVRATNTITDPNRIVPVSSSIKVQGEQLPVTMPPYTIEVFEITRP